MLKRFSALTIFLFFVVFTHPKVLFCQETSSKIDSLKKLLVKTKDELVKAEILYTIAEARSSSDSTEAFDYSRRALALFGKHQDSLGIAKARNVLGLSYFHFGDAKDAEKNHRQALKISEKLLAKDSSYQNRKVWTHSNFSLGVSLSVQDRKSEELAHYLEAAPMARKIKDYRMLAIINTNFAIMYVNNKEFNKAYPYFKENSTLFKQDIAQSIKTHDRLIFAYCLKELDSLDSMKNILDEVKGNLNSSSNTVQLQLYHNILGEYYSEIENFDDALKNYSKSKEIIEANNLKWYLEGVLENVAKTYKKMGNNAMAKKYLYELFAIENILIQGKIDAAEQLSKLEEEGGNLKKALYFLNLRNSLKDSLDAANIKNEIAQLEIQYQTEKKENQILELENENSLSDLNLEKKKSQNYLLLILLGSLFFILVSGYLTYRNRQKKALLKENAQAQEIQTLKSEKERNLFGVMMEGVEQERKRLAADLHDGLGGRLSGISIKLSKLGEVEKVKKAAPELHDILANIDDSLQELRSVARNLMPETLLKYGLKAALEDYCSTLKYKDTNIVLQYYSTDEIEDRSTKLTVYRIIQELINNAVKHAKATEILVQFIHDKDKIDITVEDDGIGFDHRKNNQENGLGLTNLQNRVNFLNGKMDVSSIVNEGTSVNIQIEKI